MTLSRRKFLQRAGIMGCSVAASPLLTRMSFAAMPSDNRLVVIILRGGMDGLDVVQPYGDAAFSGLRRSLKFGEKGGASDLDGFFSLNRGLSALMPLWRKASWVLPMRFQPRIAINAAILTGRICLRPGWEWTGWGG